MIVGALRIVVASLAIGAAPAPDAFAQTSGGRRVPAALTLHEMTSRGAATARERRHAPPLRVPDSRRERRVVPDDSSSTRRQPTSAVVVPLPPPVPPPDIDAQSGAARERCVEELRAAGHRVAPAPPPVATNAACAIPDAVRLESIALKAANARLEFPDRPTLSCGFAKSVAEFSAIIVAPLAVAMLQSPPASIATGPGYECRGRNRAKGAPISAHGQGIAADVASIKLADGRVLSVEKPKTDDERRFWAGIRKAACGWFTTVLGPGADAAHTNHLHLDAARHGSSERYRLCQ